MKKTGELGWGGGGGGGGGGRTSTLTNVNLWPVDEIHPTPILFHIVGKLEVPRKERRPEH